MSDFFEALQCAVDGLQWYKQSYDIVVCMQLNVSCGAALCRWPWEILPHHQRVIVVHEPQYVLMFGIIP